MAEERLKIAVFIDFDNIQIGVKDTLSKDFDVSLVLEGLKERGEVVTKVAYGDWPRAGDHSRQMTQHAVQMVQRNVTPRGDKNGADINLALDALEMAFTRHHINTFAIVGGDSDFMALVEKLKQYDKRVFVVGGRAFTSNILQRNCTEFIAYENLLKSGYAPRVPRPSRRGEPAARGASEVRPLSEAFPNVQRALKVLAEREVSPQIGLLKSTLLQLDSTFSERDYGAGTFLEFMQKMERENLVHLRRIDRGYLVEAAEPGGIQEPAEAETAPEIHDDVSKTAPPEQTMTNAEAMEVLRQGVAAAAEKSPNRPLYLRHIRQGLKAIDKNFDERRAGFHGILDLLHQAQREGWLRLQRDRKGVWRIFPNLAAAATAREAEVVPEVSEPAAATSSTEFWEEPSAPRPVAEIHEELPVPEEPVTLEEMPGEEFTRTVEEAPQSDSASLGEAAQQHKPKKRAARGSRKSGARKASTRRKPRETADPRE